MDQTPAQLFNSYDADFQNLISSIQDKLDGSGKNLQGEQKKAALRKVEIELDEADDIVSQLEIEIQGIPTSIRGQYTSRLKHAKADLTRYRKASKESHAQVARTDLLAGFKARGTAGASDDPYGEQSDRTRLLAGTETLEDGNRRLTDSTRIALETETYGADILRSLRGQREQIENARDTLRGADTNIDRAHGKIQTMIRQ
ncbi:vesicle transport v-snare protein vti1 [Macrolepiota fuliginosa MF-IS2]|uniref:Vesicle transport v-snare protein vti1 n=1 Tax=Macrolepiota fuliginosa MF-IS2 TaxID=1400762 RepID=A0A9P5XBC2_9AGAR|nr:vesicle transport v-snare protein vti1 [Macrolepiota fuliginosa MF-IS2]